MEGQESDARLLVIEMRHQKDATKELASQVATGNERQVELIKEVHSLVNSFVASQGKVEVLTSQGDDHETRIRTVEKAVGKIEPSIDRQNKWLDKIGPTLIIMAIAAVATLFAVNPFK
jgi:hypothetical protein